jgi:hypothetical protein
MFTCEIGDREAETMMLSISSVDAAFVWPKAGAQKISPLNT